MSNFSKRHFASVIGKSEAWDFVRSLRKSLGNLKGTRGFHERGVDRSARTKQLWLRIRYNSREPWGLSSFNGV